MYQNRIVGYGEVDATELLANPNNYRIHPKMQQELLNAVMSDVGIVQNVIVNTTTGHVVDGHLRVALAMRNNQTIPVTYVNLSEEEEKVILATFDPSTQYAVNDAELYKDLLKDIETSNDVLQKLFTQELIEMKIEDPMAEDVDEALSEGNKKYILMVECSSYDEYEELIHELKGRNYTVKGNQKWL
jgi:hypothetical protein